MAGDIKEIRLEEYRALEEEHLKNRTIIFDRPIIILGIVAISLHYSYGSAIGGFISAAIIFVLTYNLGFIGNRLQSDARIVAYIALVHEGEFREKWFGWENALRQYRKWMRDHQKEKDLEKLRQEKVEYETTSVAFRFYPAMWYFHWALVFIFIFLQIMGNPLWSEIGQSIIVWAGGFVFTLIAFVLFIYVIKDLRPKRLQNSIEIELARWHSVFEDLKQ